MSHLLISLMARQLLPLIGKCLYFLIVSYVFSYFDIILL